MSRQENDNDKAAVYAVATAPPYNNDVPMATAVTAARAEPVYPASDVTKAVLAAMQVASLRKGGAGWVHFLFETDKQAKHFVTTNRLYAEGKDRSHLKGVDDRRHVGMFTVRVSPGYYEAIRERHPLLPSHDDIKPAISFSRGR